MQKTLGKVMRRKTVFVKVESSVIEISGSVHWSRRCNAYFYKHLKWNCIGIPKNSQPNDILSTYAIPTKQLVQRIGDVQSC